MVQLQIPFPSESDNSECSEVKQCQQCAVMMTSDESSGSSGSSDPDHLKGFVVLPVSPNQTVMPWAPVKTSIPGIVRVPLPSNNICTSTSTPRQSVSPSPFIIKGSVGASDPDIKLKSRVMARDTFPDPKFHGQLGTVISYYPTPGAYMVMWDLDNSWDYYSVQDFPQWFSILSPTETGTVTPTEKPCRTCNRNCTQGDRSCWWCGTANPC